jgi:hypothetical protein
MHCFGGGMTTDDRRLVEDADSDGAHSVL